MRSVTPQCCPPGWAKKMSVILLLVATLAAGSVSGVGYREIFDPADDTPDTALAGTMPVGQDGVWSSHMAGGFYVLENRDDPAAVRYFYALPGQDSWQSPGDVLRVDVGGIFPTGDYPSGAGLIFRFDPAKRFYYAFVLREGQSYAFYRRDADGLQTLVEASSDAIKPGRNHLEVRLRGDAMHLLVNGVELGNIESPKVQGQGVGLIAIGEGRFEFDDFELPNAVVTATPSRPAASAAHAPYQGRFAAKDIVLELALAAGGYRGSLQLGKERCEVSADGSPTAAESLQGSAVCGRDRFQFTAKLRDQSNLDFSLEGIRYLLTRAGQPTPAPPPPMNTSAPTGPSEWAPSRAAPPRNSLPAGFRSLRHPGGSGELLLKKERSDAGAEALLRLTLTQLHAYFGERPRLLQAFGDKRDTELQAIFAANQAGRPVQGLALVAASGNQAATVLAFDDMGCFRTTLPGMLRAVQPELPHAPVVSPPREQPLQTTMLPDGSGSIGLPPGWMLTTGIKGMTDAVGPDGSMVSLGTHGQVYTPEGLAESQRLWSSTGLPGPDISAHIPIVAYTDPVTAFPRHFEEMQRIAARDLGSQVHPQHVVRVIEHVPYPWPGGQAAIMDVEWVMEKHPPVRYRSIVLFGMQPSPAGLWTAYVSMVSSPADRFAQNIPTLLRIWESWHVSSQVHIERITKAVEDMGEVGRIIEQVHMQRETSQAAIHADWTEVIRGTTQVADPVLGELHDVPLYDVDRIVEGLNQAAGYERYRQVPLRELQ